MSKIEEIPPLFAGYILTSEKVDVIKSLSNNLDADIEDSKKFLNGIKLKFKCISQSQLESQDTQNDITRHEDISKFLETGPPNLLLPDMEGFKGLDIEKTLNKLKAKIEGMKKTEIPPKSPLHFTERTLHNMISLDLESYAASSDQFSKRFQNMKMIKSSIHCSQRNMELEEKLATMCKDMESFTKMIQANTLLSQCTEGWPENGFKSNPWKYTEIIDNLLGAINEANFMLLEYKKNIES